MSKTDLTRRVSRRGVIKTGAIAGAGLALPTIFTSGARAFTNEPTGGTVTLGFNVPQSGAYADEGADELRAYQLAVEHLNGEGDGGMLNTFSSKVLEGNGILGKKVGFVTGDTQTKSDAARASAKSMIEKDGAVMITGGSSSGVAVAVQGLCQEAGVIFMAGLTHSNDTTGKDKKANGFRHFFNAYMSGAALAPVLAARYGADRKAYHLTADYTWGWTQEESIAAATEALGWETVNKVRTPLGAGDFSSYITPVLQTDADVLILNHYGGDMVNSLTNAVQFGLRDKMVNGKQFEIVVPLFSRLMARGAGENIKGILGSTNWHWSLSDEGSQAFVKSFGTKYGFPPSQAAHTCYVQSLLYADAVARAGSFNPCAVVEALEGFEFDGLGNGPTLYRAEDHQCFKDVLVVRGKENPTSEFDLLEVVEITPAAQVTYPVDHPMFAGGALGDCNAG
ncbi:amino acid/amide ABC transporter substrate-binding protein, HAAT family (TC 3.A.1.4.-) [Celeribacter baekdonensis]|jgi:branched-chain amino acid transport system substrate-binding protein|uniref:Amino acid/amide ABC transporter substrate-binding protein, HAAT family (TC 3.A.1.4.-) n=1 Tax=Celeribacter baekdonensis TaxID=875171 RepID=A0A1G7PYB0_9RHOB|nr:substrate-binding protein [Celeribacter baekdonensis]MBU1277529.1 substrate-binding protein [Alphaproteobacteria bacterium]MBU1574300.1 substrate-binding protein [Alphaproteobacteria bacterium]MBU2076843.1 substrate-binding protein [Alphaproteobacteria bacterium]MBU2161940.1 substrate-binding protein [Alphaproteobacteria bacterium]MBU2241865.1 substrate-binding protein [Alphaproteobacteria bacterium]